MELGTSLIHYNATSAKCLSIPYTTINPESLTIKVLTPLPLCSNCHSSHHIGHKWVKGTGQAREPGKLCRHPRLHYSPSTSLPPPRLWLHSNKATPRLLSSFSRGMEADWRRERLVGGATLGGGGGAATPPPPSPLKVPVFIVNLV